MGVPILTIILKKNLCSDALKIYDMMQEYNFVSLLEIFLLLFSFLYFPSKKNQWRLDFCQ